MSKRDFLRTVVSLLGEFRANGARRVVIDFSGERDRQLADGFDFSLMRIQPDRNFYKAPRVGKRAIPRQRLSYIKPFPTTDSPWRAAIEA